MAPVSHNEREKDMHNLLQLMEEAASARDASRTNLVVSGLVQHIVASWRESFGRSVTTKFNCFFLLPFVEEFQRHLRFELAKVYEAANRQGGGIFDLSEARGVLEREREECERECDGLAGLLGKFEEVGRMLEGERARAAEGMGNE